jgi:hemerythrin-like domain-containing protein
MNPIEHLLEEHKAIMAQVAELRKAAADLKARGEAALPEALPVLGRVGYMMETELARHAKKEDEALFPAIEAIIGAQGGPTYVMRREHETIHGQGELLRQTLRELNEVEHPKIEAGREKLKQLVASGSSAEALRENVEEIIRLLDMHFGKEEQILFPMAENMLDDEAMEEVGRKIETMSR